MSALFLFIKMAKFIKWLMSAIFIKMANVSPIHRNG